MLCIKNKLTKKLSNPELAMVKTKRKECHSVLKILSRIFNYVSKHFILLRVVERKNKWIFVFKKKTNKIHLLKDKRPAPAFQSRSTQYSI